MRHNAVIVGATGAVGEELVKVLEARDYPLKSLKLVASERSAGQQMSFCGDQLPVEALSDSSFQGADLAFFAAGGDTSLEYVPKAVDAGVLVIDLSSAFRMQEHVPLVVPEVNGEEVKNHQGIIANPNCSTIQMVMALNPIHQLGHLQKVIVSTYQAASGAGLKGMNELLNQIHAYTKNEPFEIQAFQSQLLFNVIPHIDVFQEDRYTKEEKKMILETRKIMKLPDLKISATCVRVPVIRSHSESVYVETKKKVTVEEARQAFDKMPNLQVKDLLKSGEYPMPLDVSGSYDTYVGRIREGLVDPNSLAFWVVADQILKGAALNAVQIAEQT